MVQRVLRIEKDGSLELDGAAVSLAEYEDVLKQDQKKGDSTPIEVHLSIYTDENSPTGQIFTALIELSDQYDHPTVMKMGTVK
ncbi:MAG: hypothetical protein AAGH53_01260 [Pseudomonadota bacterium]